MKFFRTVVIIGACHWGAWSVAAQETNEPKQLPPVTVEGVALTPVAQADSSATTTVSGDEVRPGEVTSIRDLTAQTPNLSVFDGNNNRTPRFSLRGFRENTFTVGEPVVGMYVDDVPYFDLNSRDVSLYNVQSIQFARGEQGTLYGASGVGGVMDITTAQPGNAWHGSTTLSFGDYSADSFQAGAGGALVTNKLYLSLDGLYGFRDGYVHNLTLNTHPDTQDTLSGRVALRWTPSDPWSITFSATGDRFHDGFVSTYRPGVFGGFAPPDPSPFAVRRNVDGFVNTKDDSQALKVSYDAGPVIATSVTTHRDWRQSLLQDFDFSPFPIATGFSQPKVEQWGEEARVKSPEDADKLKWLGGLYFLDNDARSFSGSAPGVPSATDADGQTYAVFGQGTYTLWEKLDLTAGLRLTLDERDIQGSVVTPLGGPAPVNSSAQFSAVQPKFAMAYHFTPAAEVYASVASGYQSGGFNSFINQTQYNPARSWEFELGAKSSWFDHKLTANAALFYTDTRGYQVIRISPADPLVANLLNAHRAESYGAELELTARPVQDLELGAALGYTRALYENFLDPTSGLQLAGKPISFVPEFTANLSATYHLPWHTYVRGEVIGVGRYHLDDAYTPETGPTVQEAYALVNVQVGFALKNFEGYFFARNVFDRHYFNNAENFGAGSGNTSLILQPGDPETLGVALTARF